MKKFFTEIRDWFDTVCGMLEIVFMITGVIVTFFLILKMLEPMWPITTGLFMFMVTVVGLEGDKLSKSMTIVGIMLYLLSWPALHSMGIWPSVILCATGFGLWFNSFARSLAPKVRVVERSFLQ